MRAFSINCPRCGTEHPVRTDRLGDQLHCRRCDANFYLASSGRYVIGLKEHSAGRPDPLASSGVTMADFEGANRIDRIPRVYYLSAAGAGVIVLCLVGLWSYFSGVSSLPESLEERSAAAARAFARADVGPLLAMKSGGGSRDIRIWLEKCRPSAWEPGPDDEIEVRTEVLINDSRGGIAYVLATIRPLPRSGGGGPTVGTPTPLELPLFWTLDGHGQWKLDVARCERQGDRSR